MFNKQTLSFLSQVCASSYASHVLSCSKYSSAFEVESMLREHLSKDSYIKVATCIKNNITNKKSLRQFLCKRLFGFKSMNGVKKHFNSLVTMKDKQFFLNKTIPSPNNKTKTLYDITQSKVINSYKKFVQTEKEKLNKEVVKTFNSPFVLETDWLNHNINALVSEQPVQPYIASRQDFEDACSSLNNFHVSDNYPFSFNLFDAYTCSSFQPAFTLISLY
jgi:hypothetical protein